MSSPGEWGKKIRKSTGWNCRKPYLWGWGAYNCYYRDWEGTAKR